MTTLATNQAHIAYELIDENDPELVVVGFLSRDLGGPGQSGALGEQLDSLIRPDLPQNFVIDFANVQALGSSAFGEIVNFVHKTGHVRVCNMRGSLRLGAALIGLDDCAPLADTRQAAIREARKDVRQDDEH